MAGDTSLLGLLGGPLCAGCGRAIEPGAAGCPSCDLSTSGGASGGEDAAPDTVGEVERALRASELDVRYELGRCLGHGGMGAVFVARDRQLGREVALKVMLGATALDVKRFEREGRMLARVQHPRVLRVFAAEVAAGLPVLVLELLPGRTLKRELEMAGPFTPARARDAGVGVLDGLSAAHQLGVIHRDLKLDNVLVDETGELKILDFGLARDATGSRNLTQAGAVMGTPCYMSPEQCEGREVTLHSDLYACGVMLFEMATGRLPFTGAFPMEILVKHIKEVPPEVGALVPGFPAPFAALIARALSKDPAARHETAAAMRDELAALKLSKRQVPVRRGGAARSVAVRRPLVSRATAAATLTAAPAPAAGAWVRPGVAFAAVLALVAVSAVALSTWRGRPPPSVRESAAARVTPASPGSPIGPAPAVKLGRIDLIENEAAAAGSLGSLVCGRRRSLLTFKTNHVVRIEVWTAPDPAPDEKKPQRRLTSAELAKFPGALRWTRVPATSAPGTAFLVPVPWTDDVPRLVLVTTLERSPDGCNALLLFGEQRPDVPTVARSPQRFCDAPLDPSLRKGPLDLESKKTLARRLIDRGEPEKVAQLFAAQPAAGLVELFQGISMQLRLVQDPASIRAIFDRITAADAPATPALGSQCSIALPSLIARDDETCRRLVQRAAAGVSWAVYAPSILCESGRADAGAHIETLVASWERNTSVDPKVFDFIGFVGRSTGTCALPALARALTPETLAKLVERVGDQNAPSLKVAIIGQRDTSIVERIVPAMEPLQTIKDLRWSWYPDAAAASDTHSTAVHDLLFRASTHPSNVPHLDRDAAALALAKLTHDGTRIPAITIERPASAHLALAWAQCPRGENTLAAWARKPGQDGLTVGVAAFVLAWKHPQTWSPLVQEVRTANPGAAPGLDEIRRWLPPPDIDGARVTVLIPPVDRNGARALAHPTRLRVKRGYRVRETLAHGFQRKGGSQVALEPLPLTPVFLRLASDLFQNPSLDLKPDDPRLPLAADTELVIDVPGTGFAWVTLEIAPSN